MYGQAVVNVCCLCVCNACIVHQNLDRKLQPYHCRYLDGLVSVSVHIWGFVGSLMIFSDQFMSVYFKFTAGCAIEIISKNWY